MDSVTFRGQAASRIYDIDALVERLNAQWERVGSYAVNDETLEALSREEKASCLQSFKQKTGFPDLEAIATTIERHARERILGAVALSGVPVLWAGYDKSCSVGRRLSLPGSDLDHLIILVKGTPADAQMFKAAMKPYDRCIANEGNQCEIVSEEELKSFQQACEGFIKAFDWEAYKREFKYVPKDWTPLTVFMQRHPWGKYGFGNDPGPSKCSYSKAEIYELIRDGQSLIDHLGFNELWIRDSIFYKETDFLQQKKHIHHYPKLAKAKYSARIPLVQQFDSLTLDEQFLILRIILMKRVCIISKDFLSLSPDNGHLPTLLSLMDKEILHDTHDLEWKQHCQECPELNRDKSKPERAIVNW